MKIGIYGGSFNPPHNMHKNIAVKLIEKGYLDKVVYVPTGDGYEKDNLAPFKDRYNMVKLMIKNNDKLSISKIANNKKYKYTYQTLDYFKNIYKSDDIYFICGTDNLKEFNTWKRYEYILKNYKLLVIKRNNDGKEVLNSFNEYKSSIILTDINTHNLSSTIIRNNLESEEVKGKLDVKVYEYLKTNLIYERR